MKTRIVALSMILASLCAVSVQAEESTPGLRQVLAANTEVVNVLPLGANDTFVGIKGRWIFNPSMSDAFVNEFPSYCKTEWQIQVIETDLMSGRDAKKWETLDSDKIAKKPRLLQEHTTAKNITLYGSRCKDVFDWIPNTSTTRDGDKYLSGTAYIIHVDPQPFVWKNEDIKEPEEPTADGIVPPEYFGKMRPNFIETVAWANTLCERKAGKLEMFPIAGYRANIYSSISEIVTQWPDQYFLGCKTNQADGFLVKVFTKENCNGANCKVFAYQRNRTIESVLRGK